MVEIVKDMGAMMVTGGYLIIGADDQGQPSGEPEHLDLFDPAKLHAKAAKYISGPFELRVGIHQHQGQPFVLIYVAPHPDGFCVFTTSGNYTEPGKGQRQAFRTGEVYGRHGTSSQPWNQHDIVAIKQRLAADADRGRDQAAEALELLRTCPRSSVNPACGWRLR